MFSSGIFIFAVTLGVVSASNYTVKNTLVTNLLTNYNRDLRPVVNQSVTTEVSLRIVIFSVNEIDPIKGSLALTASFYCQWTDELLTWDPIQYPGIYSHVFQQKQVWTPHASIVSSLDLTNIGEDMTQRVKIYANGRAYWQPSHVLNIKCDFYMKFWPFDKQICSVYILVLDDIASEVKLTLDDPIVDTSRVLMSEWILEDNVKITEGGSYLSMVNFALKFKRQPAFYVLTLILPIALIGILIPFVFILPSDSGERIGFSITIMLSLAVFLTVISEEIPRTTNPVAWISGYVMLLTLASVIATILTIINLQIYHRGDKQDIGKFWKTVSGLRKFRLTRNKVQTNDQPQNNNNNNINQVTSIQDHDMKVVDIANIEKELLGEIKRQCNGTEVNQSSDCSWQDVSKGIDKLLFVITSVVVTLPSIIFLSYLSTASDYYEYNQ